MEQIKRIKGVIYARESSDDTNKAPPIAEQINRGSQYAEENNIDLVNVYKDNGYSGGDWKRPAWNQLVRDAKFHKFNIVITWNRDRIARDTEQFLYFYRNLKESFVRVYLISEKENVDLETVGDTAKNISIAMANEIFRKVTSEKVKRAYEMKKRKDKDSFSWGRKKGRYDLEKIKQLRNQGLGFREISKQVGNCSYQTIRRLLQNTHSKINQNNKEDLVTNSQVTN